MVCANCGKTHCEFIKTAYGDYLCEDCWDDYICSDTGRLEYFIGFCKGNSGWFYADAGYARQGRILVSGENLTNHSDWFMGMFYASNVLDPARSNIKK